MKKPLADRIAPVAFAVSIAAPPPMPARKASVDTAMMRPRKA